MWHWRFFVSYTENFVSRLVIKRKELEQEVAVKVRMILFLARCGLD